VLQGAVFRRPRGIEEVRLRVYWVDLACCLMQALPGKELSDVDRHTLLSFRLAFGKLCEGELLVYSKLGKGGECEWMRVEAGGGAKGYWR
jgi:hypothetical protein